MISFDTNILLYALNKDCKEFEPARNVLDQHGSATDVVLSELVLVELYLLLRNPAVLSRPFSAEKAAKTAEQFRKNPHWRLVESAPIMDEVWRWAAKKGVARRHIIDARLALTLRHHGVTEFMTRNTRDFEGFGFERLFNPIDPQPR